MAEFQSGSNPAVSADVDAGSNGIRVGHYEPSGVPAMAVERAQPEQVAGSIVMGRNDRSIVPVRTDRMGNLASARHAPLLHEPFEGATIHATRWDVIATTMSAAQTTVGGLVINSGNITTINTGYMARSSLRFAKMQRAPLQAKIRVRLNRVNNAVQELGFGDAPTFNGAHTAGAYWQVAANGAVQPVLTFNSVDQTGNNISASLDPSRYYTFDVIMDDDEAIFICQDTATGLLIDWQSIPLSTTAQRLLSATALPVFARLYNTGTAPATAPSLIVTDLYVLGLDIDRNAPWSNVMAGMGRSALENPFTGAALANFANGAAPGLATLSNTAAGYTTLGGNFSFTTLAGAATDYCLFGFQVPVGANLRVTGMDVETYNFGGAIATTPVVLQWFASQNQPAVTLATNSFRANVGLQSLAVGAAQGAQANRIAKPYQTPLVTNSGRFFVVGFRAPIATAGQTISGNVNIEGYWD